MIVNIYIHTYEGEVKFIIKKGYLHVRLTLLLFIQASVFFFTSFVVG
jgi:hypothetical protein